MWYTAKQLKIGDEIVAFENDIGLKMNSCNYIIRNIVNEDFLYIYINSYGYFTDEHNIRFKIKRRRTQLEYELALDFLVD